MGKKVLAIFYSQTGQLEQIIDHFIAPLIESGASVEKQRIKPVVDFAFPWTGKRFFDVMPEAVLARPVELETFSCGEPAYDLVVFGYQAWFLSPSIPITSILNHPSFQQVITGTPVITITAARNMWISAMERVKQSLHTSKARLVGNIALVDKHPNMISFVTLLYWMFTGKKDRYLSIFPAPGISSQDILHTGVYGSDVLESLNKGEWSGLQKRLVDHGGVVVNYYLMFIESKAKRIFLLWAKFIVKRKKRTAWLVVFKYYLLIALFIAAPIILLVDAVFFRPFLSRRIRRQKQYYSGVN